MIKEKKKINMLSDGGIRKYEENACINPIIESASIGAVSEEITRELECYKKLIKKLLR